MSDINTNISVNIDTSGALGQLKALQRQISTFHTSIAKSSQTASLAQADLQKNFLNAVNGIGAFSAELRTVKTSAENFTSSLEKNKFSMREYFRYAGGATQTFGKLFRSEFETINKVATENVKNLQTQYIKMGRDANGAMKAIAVRPLTLDMQNLSTQTQIAAQRQALFNQLVKQGSTNLLNFGKNTQWAGRQLMVGFTLPLMALGTAASKTFMEMEAAALKFKKVYGDLFTAPEETQKALDGITELAQGFTQYGIAVSKTVGLASEAAAAGFAGLDLQRQTTAATKLSVLGQIEQQQALETTISLQNAMGISSQQLAESIDFLNAVENQTVTSLDDITIAIPKVAPVIKSLGGDVKDLAFFMTAMKEGGINASEGANALKSGLASMINPAKKSAAMLADMGININGIVEKNRGNLRATVVEFAQALDKLDPLSRARAIEQMFGKFQFARLSTLFQNVIKDGTQAERVLQLAGSSVEELAALSDKELGMTADSAMNKFKKSVEDLKFALVPVGKVFLEVITPFLEKISGLIERFNNLSDSTKKIITVVTVGLGAIAPVILMTVGLLANFVANGIKGLMILRNGYLRLTGQSQILGEQTQYLTMEQIDAAASAASLDQAHSKLKQTFTAEATAVSQLIAAYQAATLAGAKFAAINPGMMRAPGVPTKRAKGKPVVVGGTGNKDTELALLTPGETVIPAEMSKKYGALINGMIAGNIPGYINGKYESSSGKFNKTFADVGGDSNRLYASPKIIGSQTDTMEWSTLEAEKQAIELATRGYLETLGLTAKEVQEKINNLQRVQASHINKEVSTQVIAGQPRDIKQWNAANLQADLGAINNFLNVLPKIAKTFDDSKIAELAAKLNITVDEFKAELSQLQEGIHPGTQQSADVLLSVAQEGAAVDPSTGKTKKVRDELEKIKYQSLGAEAALQTRNKGDYYATLPDRAYDPAKDVAVAQDVANRAAKTQATLLASFDISDEIAQISGKNKAALQNAWNSLTTEQKEGLLALKDDANAFTSALLNEAKEAGVAGFELGNSAIQGISKGIQDGSPSKKAKQKGKNVIDGFEQGILEGVDDASIAGSQVGNAAVDSLATTGVVSHAMGAGRGVVRPQGAAPIGPATPNTASLLPLIAAPLINANQAVAESTRDLVDLNNNQKAAMQLSTSKLASMNKTLNSATFALTAMAGAGSMFGGKIGEVSNQIFKYSGLMFGLMQITQLLTQAKVLELAASRAANAGLLVQNINTRAFSKTPGLFAGGIKKLLPNLLRFGGMIGRFLGPIGLAITAITITVGIINRVNAARERERLAIEGLGDAALLSKEKIKNLGEFFGIPTTTSPFRSQTAQVKGTTQERSQIDALKETENFKKDYKSTIDSLKTATDEQATLIFDSLAVQLRGSGFAKEQIELIIAALREESGKTNVEFDFKKLDLTTDKGILNFQQTLDELSGKLASSFSTGYSEKIATGLNVATGEIETWTEQSISKALKKDLHLTAKAFTAFIDGISGQLANGTISADQFNQAFARISSQIAAMPQPQAMLILNKIMQELPEDIRSSALGLKNVSDRMLILQAQAVGLTANLLGVVEAMNLIANPTADISDKIFSQMRIDKFKKDIQAATKAFEDFFATKNNDSGAVSGEKGLSGLSKKVIEGLKKELKLLEDKKKALQEVNDEIERQQEFQQKQQELDADITQAKISGNYIQAALLGQQKLYNKSQYDRQTAELALDKQIQQLQDRINALEDGAKVTALDRKLANVESAISDAATKNDSKTSSKTSSGKDTKTNTDKQKADDKKAADTAAKKAAEAKKAELEAKMPKLFKARVKDIPPYQKYLEAVQSKHKYNKQDYTVAFDLRSQRWKEVIFQNVPNEYISIEEWEDGKKTYTQTYATGGHVKYFGPGGDVSGPGTATSDSIPAYLSNGEYVIKAASVNKYGTETFDALNAGRFAIGGPITRPRQRKPGVPYSRSGKPIGDPFGQYWGELSRFIGPRRPGMDIWGGTEIPGLKFTGKIPQMSDYWHQMQEQPRKPFNGPGMGLDKDPMRYAGSGASMGGIGNGAYGLGALMFAKGGPVGGAPHGLGMSSFGSSKEKKPSLLSKIVHKAMKIIDPFKAGKHSLGYEFLGGKEIANVLSGTGTKTDYLSAALTPLGIGKVGKTASVASKFGAPDIGVLKRFIERPLLNADAMATILHKGTFAEDAGTFFRALSKHDMAAIAGYVRVPNPNKYDDAYKSIFSDQPDIVDKTVEAPWSSLARRWSKEGKSKFPIGSKDYPIDYSEAALPYLDLDPALKIGESWIPNIVKSITKELEFAKEIAVKGGTGGGENKAIAKIIVDPMVQGISDFKKLMPGHNASQYNSSYTEGAIAPFTRYILEGINKNAHHLTDVKSGVSHLIDEYVFKAVHTSPYAQFLGRDLAIKNGKDSWEKVLPIVKKANGGMVNYKLPSYDVGSPYIPEDQIAQLHKGERVLTAEENKNFSSSGPITNIININGTDLNKKEIAQAVMVELDRVQKKNNKSNKVNK